MITSEFFHEDIDTKSPEMDEIKVIIKRRHVCFHEIAFRDARSLIIHKINLTKIDENFAFADKLWKFFSANICLNMVLLQKYVCFTPLLSGTIIPVRLNSSKMVVILTLPSAMESSQGVMKLLTSFKIRTVPFYGILRQMLT